MGAGCGADNLSNPLWDELGHAPPGARAPPPREVRLLPLPAGDGGGAGRGGRLGHLPPRPHGRSPLPDGRAHRGCAVENVLSPERPFKVENSHSPGPPHAAGSRGSGRVSAGPRLRKRDGRALLGAEGPEGGGGIPRSPTHGSLGPTAYGWQLGRGEAWAVTRPAPTRPAELSWGGSPVAPRPLVPVTCFHRDGTRPPSSGGGRTEKGALCPGGGTGGGGRAVPRSLPCSSFRRCSWLKLGT